MKLYAAKTINRNGEIIADVIGYEPCVFEFDATDFDSEEEYQEFINEGKETFTPRTISGIVCDDYDSYDEAMAMSILSAKQAGYVESCEEALALAEIQASYRTYKMNHRRLIRQRIKSGDLTIRTIASQAGVNPEHINKVLFGNQEPNKNLKVFLHL